MTTTPTLVRFSSPSGEDRYSLGHPLLDRYLESVAGLLCAFGPAGSVSLTDQGPCGVSRNRLIALRCRS
jgi:hypothetical protein